MKPVNLFNIPPKSNSALIFSPLEKKPFINLRVNSPTSCSLDVTKSMWPLIMRLVVVVNFNYSVWFVRPLSTRCTHAWVVQARCISARRSNIYYRLMRFCFRKNDEKPHKLYAFKCESLGSHTGWKWTRNQHEINMESTRNEQRMK